MEKSLTSAVKEMRDKALFPEDCSQETLIGVCMSVYFPKLCVTLLLVPDWYFLEDNSLTLISCVFFFNEGNRNSRNDCVEVLAQWLVQGHNHNTLLRISSIFQLKAFKIVP